MNRWIRGGLVAAMATVILVGCAADGPKVTRLDAKAASDLSGQWNDTDSRLVSEEMIKDCLSRPWISRFERSNRRAPTVIVGTVRNLSHEHINVNTFTNDVERALINSGMVEFVASKAERDEIRGERVDQDLHASAKSRKEMGQELGADFMLKGSINTIVDTDGKTQVRFYQIDLTLISLKDNRKVWMGQKKIKKLLKNANIRY